MLDKEKHSNHMKNTDTMDFQSKESYSVSQSSLILTDKGFKPTTKENK